MTSSKYAPVVETRCKRKKSKVEPLSVNNRFPGGGFAARMKKLMDEREQSNGGRCNRIKIVSHKMPFRVLSSESRKKGASRKKGGIREGIISKCLKNIGKQNNQLKSQSSCGGGGGSPVVPNKDEEVVIEDFDSQELLQEASVRAGGDSGAVKRTTNNRNGKDQSLGETSCSKIVGLLPGAGSSKTVVINSQPQFAPSQLDEERKVLASKPKECKQGILKKGVSSSCNSKPVQEDVPSFHSKKLNGALEDELSISSVEQANQKQGSGSDVLAGIFGDFEDVEDEKDAGSGCEGGATADKDNDESADEVEENVQEEEVDALADMFSDYEGPGQNNSELGMDTQ